MKTVRSFVCEMKQIVISMPFLVSCMIVTILEFTAGFYLTGDGKELSILEVLINFSKEDMKENVLFSSFAAFRSGVGSWLKLFVPIIAALPFAALFRDETSTGYRRFRIISEGKVRYCVLKILTCFFSGALTLTIGTLLFALMTGIFFPSIQQFDTESINMILAPYGTNSTALIMFRQILMIFLYGGFWGSVCLGMVGTVKNKYLIVGIPFMLKYMWQQYIDKIGGMGPDTLLYAFQEENSISGILIVYIILLAVSVLVFFLAIERKEDIGV